MDLEQVVDGANETPFARCSGESSAGESPEPEVGFDVPEDRLDDGLAFGVGRRPQINTAVCATSARRQLQSVGHIALVDGQDFDLGEPGPKCLAARPPIPRTSRR